MNISWVRSNKDRQSFQIAKNLGFPVVEIKDLETTDETIGDLVKQKYHTIILSNEVASFSEDIIKKYEKQEEVRIIIAPSKK